MLQRVGAALCGAIAFAILTPGAMSPCLAAPQGDPTVVIGELRLRQSVAAVRAQYPQMQPLVGGMGVSFADGPDVKRFVLKGVTPPGLKKPCDIELRFWKGQLWLAIVYFGDNDAVREALEERYGAKGSATQQYFWDGPTYSAALQTKNRWYSIQDPQLTAEAQRWFLTEMGREVAPAAPTPGAAAAAPTGAGAEK